MSKKTLILLLVVLGLLFGSGVVTGLVRADEPHDPDAEPPGTASALDSVLGFMAPKLDLAQVVARGGKLDIAKRTLTIPKASKTCTLTIAKSDDDVRVARLELVSPPVVNVVSHEPNPEETPKPRKLEAGSPISLAFRQRGGLIVITHAGLTDCILRLPE